MAPADVAAGGELAASAYWDSVMETRGDSGGGPHWRAYCDALHGRLLDRWLGDRRFRVSLKTDLFDEVAGEGLAGALARRSHRVCTLDVSPAIAAAARRRDPWIVATVTDVRRLAFEDGSFDLVLSNSTLDHFADAADIERALAELFRVTAPGGTLVLTLDNPRNPAVALRFLPTRALLYRSGILPYFMGKTLSADALPAWVDRAGFVVEARTTLMHVPRLPAMVLARLLDRFAPTGEPDGFVRLLGVWEALGRLPTRRVTAYYNAVMARKPGGSRG